MLGPKQFFDKIFLELNNFVKKQAGAELGQAQLKLELELCWYIIDS